jgi:hypothetical protein
MTHVNDISGRKPQRYLNRLDFLFGSEGDVRVTTSSLNSPDGLPDPAFLSFLGVHYLRGQDLPLTTKASCSNFNYSRASWTGSATYPMSVITTLNNEDDSSTSAG